MSNPLCTTVVNDGGFFYYKIRFQNIANVSYAPNNNILAPYYRAKIFKLKKSCLKLLNLCHVFVFFLTFENSNQIKLLQIASD